MAIAAGATGGPGWTDILTAIGTVGAVVVAVGIALWTERRSGRRIKAEHERSDKVLREERELAAATLAGQREHAAAELTEQRLHERSAVEDEREHGRKQLEQERRLAREREQYAEAHAVQVAFGDTAPDGKVRDNMGDLKPVEVRALAAIVVNRSSSTITRVEAQFCLGNSMISHHRYERVSGFQQVPDKLREGYRPSPERMMSGVLTPFDIGIRFETDEIHERHLAGPYPVVRWTDRWGARWEHKRGVVRPIREDELWEP
jgi:hypothetical protein